MLLGKIENMQKKSKKIDLKNLYKKIMSHLKMAKSFGLFIPLSTSTHTNSKLSKFNEHYISINEIQIHPKKRKVINYHNVYQFCLLLLTPYMQIHFLQRINTCVLEFGS